MKTPYTIYDPITFDVLCSMEYEEQPKNSTTEILMDSFIKPKFNPETNTFYEGATKTEMIVIEIEKRRAINAKRRQDGIDAYERVASEMDVYVAMGLISSGNFEYISNTMKPVRTEIVNGRWEEAKKVLEDLQTQLDDKTYNKFLKIINEYLGV